MLDNESAPSQAQEPESPRTLPEGQAGLVVPAVAGQSGTAEAPQSPGLRTSDGRFLPGVRQPTAKVWLPGQSGNPEGTSKAQRLTRKLIESLDKNDGEMVDALIRVALKEALKGNYQFWQHIFDRCDGSIAQRLAGHDGGPLQGGASVDQAHLTLIMNNPQAMEHAAALGNLLFPDELPPPPSGAEQTLLTSRTQDTQEPGHAE